MPREVLDHLPDRRAQAKLHRIIAAVGRRVGLDVLGRRRRAGENVVVVEVGAVQDLRTHRVEEGLGEFGLLVVDQVPDVEQLQLLPGRVVDRCGTEIGSKEVGGLGDPLVVRTDSLANGHMHALPVGCFEEFLGFSTVTTDQLIVPVEAIDHRLGNALGEHVLGSGNVHGAGRQV